MLKRYFYNACVLGIITFLLAACTQEAMDPTLLAAGKSPIIVTAIQSSHASDVSQTRTMDVLDGTAVKSAWTDGDKIQMWVSSRVADDTLTTICTLDANGKVTQYAPQLYWNTIGKHEIHAWYSNIEGCNTTDQVVNISDQTHGLAYVMKADSVTYTYFHGQNGEIPLVFRHQLAKVKVKLQAQGNQVIDLDNAYVKLKKCYAACTIQQGEVIPLGKADETIWMMPPTKADGYFEANVIPEGKNLEKSTLTFEIMVDGKLSEVTFTLPISLEAGKVCSITITCDV